MQLETRCLVIGSGVAGLSTAIALAELGIETTVISCAPALYETNTFHAQGGIIYRGLEDSASRLKEDILTAGCHINYPAAVEQLAVLGPQLVRSILIEKAGISFDSKGGEFHLTKEAAHTSARILHRGDESGRAIEEGLLAYCETLPKIKFLTRSTAVDLLMSSYHGKDRATRHERSACFGAFVFHQGESKVYPIPAEHTILATGGIGQLYLHNTNHKFARGDGLALAHRAGCRLENLEYLQFHPTTFYHSQSRRFLISEAVRGEGGVLINRSGQPFLSKFLPGFAVPELAPRDKVARAIHEEMLSTDEPCVYLDISHREPDWVRERFPFVYRSCLNYGIDVTREPIPVVPGAHYHIGGVWTDLSGRTSISNLWAVGEVACTGLHGANRLASTSLLEGLVWGTRAAEEIARHLGAKINPKIPDIEPWEHETEHADPSFLTQDWLTLKHTMWNYVGLIKTDARLERAEGILRELARGIEVFYRKAVLSDDLIGLRHASLTALLLLEACKRNPQSLGCYLREEVGI